MRDLVEQNMNEFINMHPDRNLLLQLIVSEGEGWYQFGTKRLNVKCDNNQLKVRIGGGYCTIDDYVDKNLPFEVARLRPDPFVRGTSVIGKNSSKAEEVSTTGVSVDENI
jgi:hypothetical protein